MHSCLAILSGGGGSHLDETELMISEAVFRFSNPLWAMTVLGLLSKQLFADAVLGHIVAQCVFDNLFTTVSLV